MSHKLKTICCECDELIQDGPQPDSEVSQGFCKRCYGVIMAWMEGKPYDIEHAKKITCIT